MKIIKNNPRKLDQSRASGTRTSPTTRSGFSQGRFPRQGEKLSREGRGSREEAGSPLGKRGLAAYAERAVRDGAEPEPRGSGSRRRRREERRRSGESERASESIVVADPVGTLTPCSRRSPPSPLLCIFPGSCRVAVPSITRSYLTLPPRPPSPPAPSVHSTDAIAYLAAFPRNLRSPLPFPRPSCAFFPLDFSNGLSYFPFYLLRRSPLLRCAVPRAREPSPIHFSSRPRFQFLARRRERVIPPRRKT